MNRTIAHTIMGAFDFLALAACYHVVSQWSSIHRQINAGVAGITYQSMFGLYALTLIVPVAHASSLVHWKGTAKKWANRILVAVLVATFTGALATEYLMQSAIREAGYHYCEVKSERLTVSIFKTYVKGQCP
jgi:apolipoprotein N-acyltransferase